MKIEERMYVAKIIRNSATISKATFMAPNLKRAYWVGLKLFGPRKGVEYMEVMEMPEKFSQTTTIRRMKI